MGPVVTHMTLLVKLINRAIGTMEIDPRGQYTVLQVQCPEEEEPREYEECLSVL